MRTETARQPDGGAGRKIFQAKHRAAAIALKMRMITVMGMTCGIKTPGAIIAGNAVRQIVGGQPLQDAVNGDAIHAAPAFDPLLQLLVGQRTLRCEQCRKNLDARRRHTGACAPYQSLRPLMMPFACHAGIET